MYIDSSRRVSGSNESFVYQIQLPKNKTFTHCTLMDFTCPKSYYNVPAGFNSMTLTENGVSATVSITAGNYNRITLATALKTALDAASPNGVTYTIAYNGSSIVQDGLFHYSCAGGGGVQPIFTFTTGLTSAMGFSPNTSYQFSGSALTSANCISLIGETTLFVHASLCDNYTDNILQQVYVSNTIDSSVIRYQNTGDIISNSRRFIGNGWNSFTISLCDENATPMDLNGLAWFCTILFFRESDLDEYIKSAIQLYALKYKPDSTHEALWNIYGSKQLHPQMADRDEKNKDNNFSSVPSNS